MKDVFKKLSHFEAGKVLDAATGRGDFINVIKQNFKSYDQIIGVDNSDNMVKLAQNAFPENDIEIYKMDLENLSFTDDYFDTVCISNSLHHIEHKDKVFKEMMRVLKKKGLFVLVEMYKDGKQTQAQQTHIMMHHWFARIDTLNNVYHWETFDKEDIIKMVDKLPLKNVTLEDFYIPVDNPTDPKIIDPMIKNVQEWIKKCESIPQAECICKEGWEIIERIKQVGYVSASRMLITGIKK